MKTFFVSIFTAIRKKPGLFLVGAALLLVGMVFLLTRGGDEPSSSGSSDNRPSIESVEEATEPPTRELDPDVLPSRDEVSSSYDDDPERKQEEIDRIDSRPIIQLLPYYRGNVVIDLVSIAPNDKPVLEIVGASKGEAQQVWSELLAETGDQADNYVLVYKGGA